MWHLPTTDTLNLASVFSSVSAVAQQGEALLWSSWLEKQPGLELPSADVPKAAIAPWDDPHTKADWDKHYVDTYYSYWQQYSYWASQGWTNDATACPTGGDTAAGAKDRDSVTHIKDGQSEAESPHKGRQLDAALCDPSVLSHVFELSCTLEAGGDSKKQTQTQGEMCGSDEPSDGGNTRKRPATSSQQNTVQHAGNIMCGCVDFRIRNTVNLSLIKSNLIFD